MSALSEASTPAQDNSPANALDAAHYGQHQLDSQLAHQHPQQQPTAPPTPANDQQSVKGKQRRSSPIPRIRRACTACHAGKTRCSEVLPCQSCLKRGIGSSCVYPDPDSNEQQQQTPAPSQTAQAPPPAPYVTPSFGQIPPLAPPYYYSYPSASDSTSAFRSNKRPRPLTEEEAAAITRNFQRGDFYVGSSGPVRIDPRLPVRLTLGEGDHVHFTISEALM